MATPNIVPRADSEGGLGTASKYWASAYIDAIYVGAGFVGRDADNRVDFALDNEIAFKANGANRLYVGSSHLYPAANNALSLGYATREFSDLFLGDGAVINFDDGNVTLTHSSGKLTLADSDALTFGTQNDLQIFHGGTNSNIDNYTGDLIISNTSNGNDVILKCDDGSGGLATYLTLDGGDVKTNVFKTMEFQDNVKLAIGDSEDLIIDHNATNSRITNYTGNLEIINNADDGDIIFQSDNGSGGVDTYFIVDGGSHTIDFFKQAHFYDNVKATFGAGNDLQIYHDGTYNVIKATSGHMLIKQDSNDQDIILQSDDGAGGTTTYFYLDGSSAAHDGSATTALYTNWPDNSKISLGTSHDLKIFHDSNNSNIENNVGALFITNRQDDGDIIFKSDDGSGGVATYLTLDGGDTTIKIDQNTRVLDSKYLALGSGSDLQLSHDGSNSKIVANGTGALIITQGAADQDIILKCDDGSGGETAYLTLDGGATAIVADKSIYMADNKRFYAGGGGDLGIYHDGSNSALLNETGDLFIQQNADNKDIRFQCDNGSGGLTDYIKLDGSAGYTIASKTLNWLDGVYGSWGTSGDLLIYHDGSNSYINNATGNLQIKNSTDDGDIEFVCDDGSGGNATYMVIDGSIERVNFHKHTIHNDNIEASWGSNVDLRIKHDGTDSSVKNYEGDLIFQQNADDKDIIFQSDDGSGGTTPYLTLDGGDVSTIVNTIKVLMPNLPTSDPGTTGQLWNDNGTLKISAGG